MAKFSMLAGSIKNTPQRPRGKIRPRLILFKISLGRILLEVQFHYFQEYHEYHFGMYFITAACVMIKSAPSKINPLS